MNCFLVISSLVNTLRILWTFPPLSSLLKAASQVFVPNDSYPKVFWSLGKKLYVHTLQQSKFL